MQVSAQLYFSLRESNQKTIVQELVFVFKSNKDF